MYFAFSFNKTERNNVLNMNTDQSFIISFYSPTNAKVIVLKTILKFTLKQLRHVSVQSTSEQCNIHKTNKDTTNICSHINIDLIIHRCTIIDYINLYSTCVLDAGRQLKSPGLEGPTRKTAAASAI